MTKYYDYNQPASQSLIAETEITPNQKSGQHVVFQGKFKKQTKFIDISNVWQSTKSAHRQIFKFMRYSMTGGTRITI